MNSNNLDTALSWRRAKRMVWDGSHSDTVKVPKQLERQLPPGFDRSILSLPNGASKVYRDNRPTDSFQIREYDDYWTIQLDKHNPETGNAIKHALVDATAYTAIAGIGIAALASNWG